MRTTSEAFVATKLDAVSFDALLASHDPFNALDCLLDLTNVQLITPSGLVQLAAVCHALAQKGRRPLIKLQDPAVRSYLLRAAFIDVVEDVAEFAPSFPLSATRNYERMRGSNPMLIEVTKVEAGAALPALLEQIVWVLRKRLKYRKSDAFDAATAVSEICQNTFDHNDGTCGFLAMQVYGRGGKRFVEIGVSDYGDGLATTLRRNPKHPPLASDMDAIRLATQRGTSEHDDPTRGTGLYHLLEIAYKHAGAVQIRSGQAKVRYRMDMRKGWAFSVAWMPGVQIALTLRSKVGA